MSRTKMLRMALGAGALSMVAATGCVPSHFDFGLGSQAESFGQSGSTEVSNKIDILWVVDNSASMDPLQQNLASNFSSFINNFVAKGYDFHLAVTTSDAYLADPLFLNRPAYAQLRDGTDATSHSGVFNITPTTPNIVSTFITNATQGSQGSGDERVFSSLKATLNSPLNDGFLRPDSFLAIIILSDEDDFSNPTRQSGAGKDHDYTQAGLESVDSYVGYLDQLTGSSPLGRRYNVSTIGVLDETCRAQHTAVSGSTIVGKRQMALSQATNGSLGSICDSNFASVLTIVQQHILELSSKFRLGGVPDESTISVVVNGVPVPKSSVNGWTYDAGSNAIFFHGNAVPPQGAQVLVNYTPLSAN